MGVVVAIEAAATARARLREIIDRLDPGPIIDGPLLDLLRWMADYYLASLSEVLQTALPGALQIETEKLVELIAEPPPAARLNSDDSAVLVRLRGSGPVAVSELEKDAGASAVASLQRLRRRKLIAFSERFTREVAPTRYETAYSARPLEQSDVLARRPALRALHAYLLRHPNKRVPLAELRTSFANATRKLNQLDDLGLVRQHRREVYRSVFDTPRPVDRAVALNADQRVAADAISADLDHFSPFLLLGVTGSGKTEVYLRVLAEVLRKGRSALILVPEISLTHQLVGVLRARFGESIAVLHSGLSSGERWDEWRRLARGEARIAIGARSAVFAPLRDLGAIVVDEEHDGAYKQEDGVRHHARDVAVMRAKLADCVLVLGSATASMESVHNAATGRYRRLLLPRRVAKRALPEIEIHDLRGRASGTPLGDPLAAAIEANLAGGGQSLLFLNRRGFASAMQCGACGEAVPCPNCSISLTWHERSKALRCHYCDYATVQPPRCEVCGQDALGTWGWGTERLEAFVRDRYPGARVARMDRDTTRRKGSMAALLERWNRAELDILVGTQMVTKGHDVAGVTLVGVVMADLALHLPDFRCGEKAYQQLVQVAGRAGRGERPGRVMIQTLLPDHHVLRAVAVGDFEDFTHREAEQRRELGYPPFGRLALLRFAGESLDETKAAASRCADTLRGRAPEGVAVLGPAPAAIARLRGRYRWHLLLRGRNGRALRDLAAIGQTMRGAPGVRTSVDIDPQSLL